MEHTGPRRSRSVVFIGSSGAAAEAGGVEAEAEAPATRSGDLVAAAAPRPDASLAQPAPPSSPPCGRGSGALGGPLWGAEAVRMRTARTPPQLADEASLLAALRTLVGPYATSELLVHHLRHSHGKIAWASNGYLREAVLARGAERGRPADFEPGRAAAAGAPGAGAASAAAPGPAFAGAVPELPPALWECVLGRVGAVDVRSAAPTCRSLAHAARSGPLWHALFAARFGADAAGAAAPPPAAPSPASPGGWRAAYEARVATLAAFRCPLCAQRPLSPIVYGFPSHALIAVQRAGCVLLGGDYPDAPLWCCAGCGNQWRSFPWAHGGVPHPCPPEARVAGAGAGAGVQFADAA